VLTLFAFYGDFAASSPFLRAIVTGVGAAGAGMFIGTAIKLGRPIANKPIVLVIITACFLAVAVMRLSLMFVLPVGLGVSLLLARRGKL
jgi:chromate transporter